MRKNSKAVITLLVILICGTATGKSTTQAKGHHNNPAPDTDPQIKVGGADKVWLQTIVKAEPNGVAAIVALKSLLPQNFHVFATKSVDLGLVVTWDRGTIQDVLQHVMGQLKAYYVLPGDGSFTVYPGKQPIAKSAVTKKVNTAPQEDPIDQEQVQVNKELIEKIRGRLNAP